MLFDLLSCFIGTLKVLVFKIIYINRLSFKSIPKVNNGIMVVIKKIRK